MKKLAIITSHPIQYHAPLFKLLAEGKTIHPKVFYTWEQSRAGQKYDPDFKKDIEWDIPLLEGYEHQFVKNVAKDPGTHHSRGLINPDLNRQVEQWQPDAILVFGWAFVSHLRCMRHFHRKLPVLFRGDSTLLDEQSGIKRFFRKILLQWVYRHVDYALYVGTNNRDYFLRHGLNEDQLIFAPHAVDNDRFSEPDLLYRQAALEWRKELKISEKDLVLLFAGKLEPKKNPFFLLDTLQKIRSNQVKIVFTGNGVLEASLREAAAADPRVRFLDFQNQSKMPVVYRLGDIYLLPSRGPGETWGLGANEAMASGCAVMLSEKVGGAIDLVQEGRNGAVFGLAEFEKCAALIDQLAGNGQELEAMKAASREIIQAFSFTHIISAIESVLTIATAKGASRNSSRKSSRKSSGKTSRKVAGAAIKKQAS
jgi:glycosyltransferase involved in cell wall biosynthesis